MVEPKPSTSSNVIDHSSSEADSVNDQTLEGSEQSNDACELPKEDENIISKDSSIPSNDSPDTEDEATSSLKCLYCSKLSEDLKNATFEKERLEKLVAAENEAILMKAADLMGKHKLQIYEAKIKMLEETLGAQKNVRLKMANELLEKDRQICELKVQLELERDDQGETAQMRRKIDDLKNRLNAKSQLLANELATTRRLRMELGEIREHFEQAGNTQEGPVPTQKRKCETDKMDSASNSDRKFAELASENEKQMFRLNFYKRRFESFRSRIVSHLKDTTDQPPRHETQRRFLQHLMKIVDESERECDNAFTKEFTDDCSSPKSSKLEAQRTSIIASNLSDQINACLEPPVITLPGASTSCQIPLVYPQVFSSSDAFTFNSLLASTAAGQTPTAIFVPLQQQQAQTSNNCLFNNSNHTLLQQCQQQKALLTEYLRLFNHC